MICVILHIHMSLSSCQAMHVSGSEHKCHLPVTVVVIVIAIVIVIVIVGVGETPIPLSKGRERLIMDAVRDVGCHVAVASLSELHN